MTKKHWSERLTEKREQKGWTVVELAKRSGVNKDLIYKYERGGVAAPRGEIIPNLATALDVSVIWLVHGVESGVEAPAAGLPEGQAAGSRKLPIVDLSMLTSIKQSGALPAFIKEREVMFVPADENIGPRAMVVLVTSARMEPTIPEGAKVICDPDAPYKPGDCVFVVDHRLKEAVPGRLRSLAPDNSQFEVLADNKFFSTIKISSKKEGHIVGRAMGLWHRL